MEASAASAFEGQGIEDTDGDPFGDDGMGDFSQGPDPFEAPVVDREGNPVDETQVPAGEAPEPDPTVAPASTSSSPAALDGGTSGQTESDGGSGEDPTSPSTKQGDGESGLGEPDPTAESTSNEEPGVEAGGEPKAKKGDTRRKYLLFTVEAPGKFEEVSWMEKGGEMVPKGTTGARKQTVCLVHDTAEALAVGYAALGSPPEGCALVAVASNYFRVRQVAPKPLKPSKVPLTIS